MLLASSSSSRKDVFSSSKPGPSFGNEGLIERSRGTLVMHVLVKIGREPFGGRRRPRIAREMHRVRRVMVGQPERPGALRRHRDGLEIEAAERAGREPGVV